MTTFLSTVLLYATTIGLVKVMTTQTSRSIFDDYGIVCTIAEVTKTLDQLANVPHYVQQTPRRGFTFSN